MTFTAKVKDEIAKSKLNELENRNLFLGYLFTNSEVINDKIILSLENETVATKLFKTIKYCYHKDAQITVRTQKKFYKKRFFILTLEKTYLEELSNLSLDDKESIESFIKGVFLASGSINDPEKGQYHLELGFNEEKKAMYVLGLLKTHNYNFKFLKREKRYMLYLKASEEISDFLKLLGAVNSLFYFEDIRIYKDHTNMVNRLNNCEQANFEKSLKTSDKQLEMIKFLKSGDYESLLDEKTKQVADYRLKYPEESYQSLANIMSQEINQKVTKSYINHHFRKMVELYEKISKSE